MRSRDESGGVPKERCRMRSGSGRRRSSDPARRHEVWRVCNGARARSAPEMGRRHAPEAGAAGRLQPLVLGTASGLAAGSGTTFGHVCATQTRSVPKARAPRALRTACSRPQRRSNAAASADSGSRLGASSRRLVGEIPRSVKGTTAPRSRPPASNPVWPARHQAPSAVPRFP